MGLINEDLYTASSGVSLANTYVKLGSHNVQFIVHGNGTFSAATDMLIFKDADAFLQGLQPIETRNIVYPVPDPSPVYNLLYGSAKASENWANTRQYSPATGNASATGNTATTDTASAGNTDTASGGNT